MARDLPLFRLSILAPREAFEELLLAAGELKLPWHKAVERLERETQAAAREFALAKIKEWRTETKDEALTGRGH